MLPSIAFAITHFFKDNATPTLSAQHLKNNTRWSEDHYSEGQIRCCNVSFEYRQTKEKHKPAIRRNELALSLEQRATDQETSSLLQLPCCFADCGGCAKATPDGWWIPGDKRQPDNCGGDSRVPAAPHHTNSTPHWKQPTTCGIASPEQQLLHATGIVWTCYGECQVDEKSSTLPCSQNTAGLGE